MSQPRATPQSCAIIFGHRGADGRFDENPFGSTWLVFEEPGDFVFWCPETRETATWDGRAFALGEANIEDPATYTLDGRLHIHGTVGRWMLADGQGIFIVDWSQAFDRLRSCPRIRLDREVVDLYKKHMVPTIMPHVVVRAGKKAA